MKKINYYIAGLLLLCNALPLAAQQDDGAAPLGRWLTEKKDTVVRIEPCEDELCGYIDWVHPDEEQVGHNGEPLCGQRVLWGFTPSEVTRNTWVHGTIYRADDDKTFSGQLKHKDPHAITVRGFVGMPMFGKSYHLTQVSDDSYPSCS